MDEQSLNAMPGGATGPQIAMYSYGSPERRAEKSSRMRQPPNSQVNRERAALESQPIGPARKLRADIVLAPELTQDAPGAVNARGVGYELPDADIRRAEQDAAKQEKKRSFHRSPDYREDEGLNDPSNSGMRLPALSRIVTFAG
jgi:hypothetical protein